LASPSSAARAYTGLVSAGLRKPDAVLAAGWDELVWCSMKRWAGLSGNLLTIEVSYTLLASVVIGAVIGGLTGKLVETSFE
jgi:hypothetical protein